MPAGRGRAWTGASNSPSLLQHDAAVAAPWRRRRPAADRERAAAATSDAQQRPGDGDPPAIGCEPPRIRRRSSGSTGGSSR